MKKNMLLIGYCLILVSLQLWLVLSGGFAGESSRFVYSEWQFGRADGSVIANKIKLLPGGKIDGYYHPNEDHWGIERGILVFYHKNGNPSCRFTFSRTENGRQILRGQFLFNSNITHVLKEVRAESSPHIFTGKVWQFGRTDGSVIANKIRLLPGGRIDGYYHPNEDHWGIERGVLVFYHKNGNPSCRFTSSRTENGRQILRGQFLFNSNITHVLKEVRQY